jgi:hypothetical protein
MDFEIIARTCHEVNRALCESFGDHSQRPWEEAEEWQRESTYASIRWRIANPDAPASAQHDAWMQHKLAAGWVWGEAKDDRAKTHPCLVPFDRLSPQDQAKDRLFVAVVKSLAA